MGCEHALAPLSCGVLSLLLLANVAAGNDAERKASEFIASPRSVSIISGEELRRANFTSLADAVASATGVVLDDSNEGRASPIIRGMGSSRILVLVNGIRMNSGTYGLGPTRYLNYIDLSTVERIEVMRGAGSALYGSDALGGVVNVITRTAQDPQLGNEFAGMIETTWTRAGGSGDVRAELSGGKGPVSFLSGVTQAGALHSRGATLPFTGASQTGIDLSARYAIASDKNLVATIGRLQQRGERSIDEGRDFATVQYVQTPTRQHLDKIQLVLSFQHPFENLYGLPRGSVRSYNTSVQLSTTLFSKHLLTYGLETTVDQIRTSNAGSNSGASVFLQDEVELTRRLSAVVGVRHDRLRMESSLHGASWKESAVTGNTHLVFKASPAVSIFGGVAQGFRAPNIEERNLRNRSGNGLHPEHSVSLEYGTRLQNHRGHLAVSVYHSQYRDLIHDGLQNIAGANVRGIEFESMINIAEGWTWTHSTTWTLGNHIVASTPLTQIPPLNGHSRLTWQPKRTLWVECAVVAAAAQRRLFRVGPTVTPGFGIMHLRAGLSGSIFNGLTLVLENVSDKRYRMPGSSVDRPGANLLVVYTRDF